MDLSRVIGLLRPYIRVMYKGVYCKDYVRFLGLGNTRVPHTYDMAEGLGVRV